MRKQSCVYRKREDVAKVGGENEYDQNTLPKILNELIKIRIWKRISSNNILFLKSRSV